MRNWLLPDLSYGGGTGGTDTLVTLSKVTSKRARRAGLCSRSSHSRRLPPTAPHRPALPKCFVWANSLVLATPETE